MYKLKEYYFSDYSVTTMSSSSDEEEDPTSRAKNLTKLILKGCSNFLTKTKNSKRDDIPSLKSACETGFESLIFFLIYVTYFKDLQRLI